MNGLPAGGGSGTRVTIEECHVETVGHRHEVRHARPNFESVDS